MHSYYLPNVCAFCKISCAVSLRTVLLRSLFNYFDYRIAYDDAIAY